MALLQSELLRIRYELGYNTLTIGADPYISYSAVFDAVIVPYLSAGATTTSSTSVASSTTPTPVALTLADATGFHAGDVVIVDVDSRQERAVIESLSGSVARVLLSKAHATSYPVTVEGGEAIVRSILSKLYDVEEKIVAASKTAGLKSAGRNAVSWYGGNEGGSVLSSLSSIQMHWRDQLASALGVANMWRMRGFGSGGSSEVY